MEQSEAQADPRKERLERIAAIADALYGETDPDRINEGAYLIIKLTEPVGAMGLAQRIDTFLKGAKDKP